MDAFTKAYVEAALWSSNDDNDTPLDSEYGVTDFDPETLAQIAVDCAKFQADHAEIITDENVVDEDYTAIPCDSRAGHDFWLTRNGHGAGFWDGDWKEPAATKLTDASKACGEIHLYVDDEGKIYTCEG